jgi:hypothetical protein
VIAENSAETLTDVVGKVQAMTVLNPVKRGWPVWLKYVTFRVARKIPFFTHLLRELYFIHFARWTLIERIPYNGPPQQRERLNYTYLLFTSHFNGSWDQYVDSFAWTMPGHVTQMWGSSWGYPGPLPVEDFLAYTKHNQYMPSHICSAYPSATTRTILNALELKKRFGTFQDRANGLDPDEFKTEYEAFLTDTQSYLT